MIDRKDGPSAGQIRLLKEQISKLENEQAKTANLRKMQDQSVKTIQILVEQRDLLLKEKAELEKMNRGWQAKSAKDEESLQQVDAMLRRLGIITAGGKLDEETRNILNFVMLGQAAPQMAAKNGKK